MNRNVDDVLLGCATPQAFVADNTFFGCIVGRTGAVPISDVDRDIMDREKNEERRRRGVFNVR